MGLLQTLLTASAQDQAKENPKGEPVLKKIRKHANKASKQFEALNPKRSVPNVLVFVNHDDGSNFNDLRETFAGLFLRPMAVGTPQCLTLQLR